MQSTNVLIALIVISCKKESFCSACAVQKKISQLKETTLPALAGKKMRIDNYCMRFGRLPCFLLTPVIENLH